MTIDLCCLPSIVTTHRWSNLNVLHALPLVRRLHAVPLDVWEGPTNGSALRSFVGAFPMLRKTFPQNDARRAARVPARAAVFPDPRGTILKRCALTEARWPSNDGGRIRLS
jgi:hypothetical protein